MQVASLENSRRLYDLSGWRDTEYFFPDKYANGNAEHQRYWVHITGGPMSGNETPAYDLGYLLRKLPKPTYIYGVHELGGNIWTAEATHKPQIGAVRADTPEDALALLAIKLFEEGILK